MSTPCQHSLLSGCLTFSIGLPRAFEFGIQCIVEYVVVQLPPRALTLLMLRRTGTEVRGLN